MRSPPGPSQTFSGVPKRLRTSVSVETPSSSSLMRCGSHAANVSRIKAAPMAADRIDMGEE